MIEITILGLTAVDGIRWHIKKNSSPGPCSSVLLFYQRLISGPVFSNKNKVPNTLRTSLLSRNPRPKKTDITILFGFVTSITIFVTRWSMYYVFQICKKYWNICILVWTYFDILGVWNIGLYPTPIKTHNTGLLVECFI